MQPDESSPVYRELWRQGEWHDHRQQRPSLSKPRLTGCKPLTTSGQSIICRQRGVSSERAGLSQRYWFLHHGDIRIAIRDLRAEQIAASLETLSRRARLEHAARLLPAPVDR